MTHHVKETTITTDTTEPTGDQDDFLETEAIHRFFGLTYSNYLVLHRTLMQSMPDDWQRRAVAVFEELERAFRHVERPDAFIVLPATECEYSDLNANDMAELGITQSDEDEEDFYYDKDGTQHQAWDRMLVPTGADDPVPHYQRGRTRIEPRLTG